MRKQWFKVITMLTALLILAAGIQATPAKAESVSESVSILTLHATDDFKLSSMSNYFLAPYTLTNESGTDYVSFTIKDSSVVTSFKTEQAGQLVEATNVSEDTTANTRVVKFPVTDLSGVLNAQVHISTSFNGQAYEMDHAIRLAFNRTIDHAALEALVTSAEAKVKAAVVGEEEGQYPEAAKTALTEAVAAAKVKGSWLSTQALVDEAASDLTSAIAAFDAAKIAAAPNTVTLLTLHATDDFKLSSMSNYFLAPYTLTNESGTDYVSFTIKDSSVVTSFKTEQAGQLVEATNVSEDTTANTRVVKFPVADLSGVLNAQVHISTSFNGQAYEMDHAIRLAFNRTIDHAALEALVTSAEAKVKAAVVGEEEGQYPEAAKTALTEAVAAAKVKGSWLSTQALVDEAASDLTSAIAAFDAAKIGTESNTVTLLVLHATDDYKLSSMSNYFLAPYTLTNESGTDYVSFTIKDSSIVTSLKTEQDGQLVEAVKVSEDTTADTRVVKFPVADLSAVLNAQVHISTVANGNPYEMDYSIRLAFNRTIDHAALEALVASAETKLTNAVVGTEAGQYPEAAKTALTEAVAAAKVKGSWLSTQALVDEAVSDLTSAIATFEAAVIASSGSGSGSGTTPVTSTVPDGKYSINFTIKKQGTNEASVMNGYVVHPGTLNVSGGVYKVTLRLTQSNEITGFTVGGVTPTTISSNTSKNTRDVQFTVSDLTTTLSGWVKIDWPAFNYHEDYNVQIELGNYYTYSEPGYTASPSIPSTSSSNTSDDEDTAAEETDSGEASGETTTDGGTSTTTPAVTFSDVNNHWAADSVQRAVQLGIVNGYSDGSFKPNGDITRAEFTAIISRALQLKTPDQSVSFNDLSTVPAWAKPFLEQAVAAGIISGYEDNTFRPFGNITRTEMTVMVVKALGLPLESASSLTFADAAGVPEYAKAYVATAVKYGLIQGKQNNQFDPLGKATRAEALVIVLRVLDYAAAQAEEQEAAANETA